MKIGPARAYLFRKLFNKSKQGRKVDQTIFQHPEKVLREQV